LLSNGIRQVTISDFNPGLIGNCFGEHQIAAPDQAIQNDSDKYILTAEGMRFLGAVHDCSIKYLQKEVNQFLLFVELLRLHDEIVEERSKALNNISNHNIDMQIHKTLIK